MNEEEKVIVLDTKEANPRSAQGSIVQTIPKPWWNMPTVRAMLKEATLILEIRNGTMEIVMRREKEERPG